MARTPILRLRLAKAILGSRAKDFIPALRPDFGWGDDGARLKTYASKGDQIAANLAWSYAANKAIVDDCAAVELKIYRKKKDGDREEATDDKALQVLELLTNPNNAHTGEQLAQLHYSYMNFTGEGYTMMFRNGNPWEPQDGELPHALQEIPSHQVQFKLGDSYSASTVRFNGENYPIKYFVRDINPDPNNPYYGQSLIAAAASVINIDEQMRQWNSELLANGAKPSLVFSSNEPLDTESYERWKQQFDAEHQGATNAGKPLLIEGGDAKPYMLSPQDLDFLESRKFTMNEILAMWKVSPYKLGLVENVNKASAEIFDRKHARDNTLPRLRQWVRQLNVTMVQVYDPDLELGFENPVPDDMDAKLALIQAATNKFITIDEARAEYGIEALKDKLGETIYMANNNAPLAAIADGSAKPQPIAPTNDPNANNPDEPGTTDPKKDPKAKKSLDGVKKKT